MKPKKVPKCPAFYGGWHCQLPRDHRGPHRNYQYGCFLEWWSPDGKNLLKVVY